MIWIEWPLKAILSYSKPVIGQNLETCYLSCLLNYFGTIRSHVCHISHVQCFVTFEILQGRSRSRAPCASADAWSVSDSWVSCTRPTIISLLWSLLLACHSAFLYNRYNEILFLNNQIISDSAYQISSESGGILLRSEWVQLHWVQVLRLNSEIESMNVDSMDLSDEMGSQWRDNPEIDDENSAIIIRRSRRKSTLNTCK